MSFLASEGCFWSPTASMTSEVKNNYAYVIAQDICNKFIEANFCVGCMVSQPNHLLQRSPTMSLINQILFLGEGPQQHSRLAFELLKYGNFWTYDRF